MKQAFLVFIGGGLGSVFRYLIAKSLNNLNNHFFIGTFTVNVIGCLFIGIAMGLSLKNQIFSQQGILFFVTGFCGGFTTFSAFAFEKYSLFKQGETLPFLIYMAASVFVGILAVALGEWLVRNIN